MISDSEKDKIISNRKLSSDKDFFNNVFKKSEKVASVVFYILSYLPHSKTSIVHEENLTQKAFALHEIALQALQTKRYEAAEQLELLRHALVSLESSLRLTASTGLVSSDALFIVVTEIDTTLRTLNNHYLNDNQSTKLPRSATPATAPAPAVTQTPATSPRAPRVTVPANDMSSDAAVVRASMPDRATRILTVLEAAGESSIKDITDVIRDCSEKTIQRELNSLIEKGKVIRSGERRWSRYSVLNVA
ncbi:MAG: hypothetical protein AAGA35_03830 [Patescibacteria group bacterium]